jgi:hypothetical protein
MINQGSPTGAKIEKPKPKEMLFEEWREKFGLEGALLKEKSFKETEKQVSQFHEAGNSTLDFDNVLLQQLIDSGKISPPKPKDDPKQVLQQLTGQFNKPKGLFSSAQVTPEGNIQQSGALGGIFGTNTKALLDQLLTISKIQTGGLSPLEKESYELNNKIKNFQIAQIENSGEIPTEEELMSKIPEGEKEDYLVKPTKQTIRGMVNTVPILERKKSLPAKQLEDLGKFDNLEQDLDDVVNTLQTKGLRLGPGFSTTPGAISDMLGQMKGKNFAALKSDIGRNFQLYRKETTGVAAGYPELNMLAPNYPKATDKNDVFIQKSIDVIKDVKRNREILLDYFSKGGYAVSKLRKNKLEKQSSVWSPDKARRLEELRRKKAEGTLGR